MTAKHLIRYANIALGVLLIAALLALPAQTAPAPEETALNAPGSPRLSARASITAVSCAPTAP